LFDMKEAKRSRGRGRTGAGKAVGGSYLEDIRKELRSNGGNCMKREKSGIWGGDGKGHLKETNAQNHGIGEGSGMITDAIT